MASDAVGLGAFVALGTSVSLDRGTSAFVAVFMGVVTGVGGGVVRDVFSGRTPMVFVGQVYASAGLLGALAFVGLDAAAADVNLRVWASVGVVVVTRAVAVRYDLHLPRVASNRRG